MKYIEITWVKLSFFRLFQNYLVSYRSYKDASGNDVVSQPEDASFPYMAMKSSVWFWNHNKLSNLVDGSLLGFHKLVARINGAGMNHLKERVDKWKSISKTLGCPAIFDGASDDCNGGKGSCVVDSTCKTKIIPKCNGKACCPRDPKTVKCCLKSKYRCHNYNDIFSSFC